MKWFGPFPWGAAACDSLERVDIPIGRPCSWCEECIDDESKGYLIPHLGETLEEQPIHLECFIRFIVGSIAHQTHECSCYGGTASDEDFPWPVVSKRDAAERAYKYYLISAKKA